MPEFVVVLSAWREGPLIVKALEQVIPQVDRVVLSACRFAYVQDQPDDGMVGLAREFCAKHGKPITIDEESNFEYLVKTKALELVGAGNFCFFFDADEIIEGDLASGVRKVKELNVDMIGIGTEGFNLVTLKYEAQLMYRIWRVEAGDRYVDNHWMVFNGDRLKIGAMSYPGPGYTYARIPDFRIKNLPQRRTIEGQKRRLLRYAQLKAAGWDERAAKPLSRLRDMANG